MSTSCVSTAAPGERPTTAIFSHSIAPAILARRALDPARIVAVNVHVPTSTGISWPGNVYRGWGGRTDPQVAAPAAPASEKSGK